jgi:hypothetical protein
MNKQIRTVLVAIIGIIAISILLGCASGPKFGNPNAIQVLLNVVAKKYPIDIAGKKVELSFEGDSWRGKVDNKDSLAGDCTIKETDKGATLTLNQKWAWVENENPVTKKPIGWQKTPGPEFVLEYDKGPPESLTKK